MLQDTYGQFELYYNKLSFSINCDSCVIGDAIMPLRWAKVLSYVEIDCTARGNISSLKKLRFVAAFFTSSPAISMAVPHTVSSSADMSDIA